MPDEYIGICSYKGVEWFADSMPTSGGIAYAKKKFINSNRQVIDELGENPNVYSISGFIALKGEEQNYRAKKDRLIRTFNSPGVGVLNHPTFGIINNAKCVNWDIDERMDSINIGSISAVFEISNSDGNLLVDEITLSSISARNKDVSSITESVISAGVNSDPRLIGVFPAVQAKVESIGRAMKASTDFSEKLTDEIDRVGIAVSEFQDAAVFLASKPQELASEITGFFQTVSGTFATAEAAYESYKEFFNFGLGTDVKFDLNTVASAQRSKNDLVLNQSINILALSESYLAAANIDFRTVDEIEVVLDELEAQFRVVIESGDIDYELSSSLVEIRSESISLFEAKKLNTSRIVEVYESIGSARSISYQYYGSDEDAESIANINDTNGLVISDAIKVFSE